MKIIKILKEYKEINKSIKNYQYRTKEISKRLENPKLVQKLNVTGLDNRFAAKIEALEKKRYSLECESALLRILVFLNLA
jgi:hypothetical protein